MTELGATLAPNGVDASTLRTAAVVDGKPVYQLTFPGDQIQAQWERLRGIAVQTGRWPLVLGEPADPDAAHDLSERFIQVSPASVIEAALRLDVDRWLSERSEAHEDADEEFETEIGAGATSIAGRPGGGILSRLVESFTQMFTKPNPNRFQPAEVTSDHRLEPAEVTPNHQFTIPYNILTRKPHPQVAIALLPTVTPWEAAAFLTFGGWNECPEDHEHVAMMKRWFEQYGAVPFGMTSDVIEMLAERPPQDDKQALALAREQYAYCTDIVDQGTETVEGLARTLKGASAWYFWWD